MQPAPDELQNIIIQVQHRYSKHVLSEQIDEAAVFGFHLAKLGT